MKFGISILGSGSTGNSILLDYGDEALLLDAGFSRKDMLRRMGVLGIDPGKVRALLVSHEHEDHVRGARVLADHLGIPTYVSPATYRHLESKRRTGKKVILFDNGTEFGIGSFRIRPFRVPHDAVDPVGFQIQAGNLKIGIATDLGHISSLARRNLEACDALIIESNHDVKMQRDSRRHIRLQRRILGKNGHLNNDEVLEALDKLLTERTKHLFLLHLSSDCNDAELLRTLVLSRLAEIDRADILLSVAPHNETVPTIWL